RLRLMLFFSSRRRHTRCYRDWSSDVCSSDLDARGTQAPGIPITLTAMEYRVLEYLAHRPRAVVSKTELLEHLYDYNWEKFSNVRSEERRVGKECSYRR